jgi:protoporphyrinogen oxidase
MNVAIIGSGLAGVAACSALLDAGVDATIYESASYWGGHTHSEKVDGYTFDEGPHVSFTADERVREVFLRAAGRLEEFPASISNYFDGHWLTHPAQCHLHGLDPGLITRCIVDFVEAQGQPSTGGTYADWLRGTYGTTFAETFPFQYTRKYWTVPAERLGTDWVGQRMYPPRLEEVVRGAVAPDTEGDFHYLKTFRYPAEGGYQSFMMGLVRPERIRLGKHVTRIDPEGHELAFSDGSTAAFDQLISTMPLPELVAAIGPGGAPGDVSAAADDLLCTSVVLVDLAVQRPDLSPHHWFYVYDDAISMSRVHFPHRLARANAPAGRGSIQAEIYFSRYRPLPSSVDGLADRVVAELVQMGVLSGPADVLWARTRVVPYANVVFDHSRAAAMETIRPWVEGLGIVLAGRYGEWGYHWTDDATRSGWAAADRVQAMSYVHR